MCPHLSLVIPCQYWPLIGRWICDQSLEMFGHLKPTFGQQQLLLVGVVFNLHSFPHTKAAPAHSFPSSSNTFQHLTSYFLLKILKDLRLYLRTQSLENVLELSRDILGSGCWDSHLATTAPTAATAVGHSFLLQKSASHASRVTSSGTLARCCSAKVDICDF